MANFLLARLWWFRHHYQNWGKAKKIIIAFLLYLIVLPIIPIVIMLIWYVHDPEGFRKSKAFPVLSAIVVVWLAFAGYVFSRPAITGDGGSTTSANETQTTGEQGTATSTSTRTSTRTSNGGGIHAPGEPTRGRYFENCSAAFAVGVKNIPKEDKSYRPGLDRDKDGWACEK
jgi:hypothetical protein